MTETEARLLMELRECRHAHTANVYARSIASHPVTVRKRAEACERIRWTAHTLIAAIRKARSE